MSDALEYAPSQNRNISSGSASPYRTKSAIVKEVSRPLVPGVALYFARCLTASFVLACAQTDPVQNVANRLRISQAACYHYGVHLSRTFFEPFSKKPNSHGSRRTNCRTFILSLMPMVEHCPCAVPPFPVRDLSVIGDNRLLTLCRPSGLVQAAVGSRYPAEDIGNDQRPDWGAFTDGRPPRNL